MARSSSRNRIKVDWVVVLLYAILVLWGWISIYAAVFNEEAVSILNLTQEYGKQLIFMLTSLVIIGAILISNYRLWTNFAPLWYFLTMLLLVGVLFVGKKIGGARSWYGIGSFSLQPSELAKFATALMMGYYMSLPRTDVRKWPNRIVAGSIFFLPALLIGLQPDVGSSLVFISLILVLYREGMPGYYIGIALAGIALSVIGLMFPLKWALLGLLITSVLVFLLLPKRRGFFLMNGFGLLSASAVVFAVGQIMENLLAPHQQVRIRVLLGLENDPSGAGYNTLQSLIAIGSGGWTGKGFLDGTQTKLNFVPAQSTDYIFCTIGEEWGFLGSALLMLLFALLIGRIIWLSDRQKDAFSRVYGYAVASILFTHWIINIGMTIGLVPTIGIPLPFFSYGGSSLWGFTILLFIFVKLDAERWNRLS
jgi:rod shape determining protein RodA